MTLFEKLVGTSTVRRWTATAASATMALTFCAAAAVVTAPTASARGHRPSVTAANDPVTVTTPGETAYNVPAGTDAVQVTVVGAAGNEGDPTVVAPAGTPGAGATLEAVVPVPSDASTLYLEVGDSDATNGGGGTSSFAGAGGGASAIQTCSVEDTSCSYTGNPTTDPRLVVAGGGGGGGEASFATGDGGGNGGNAGASGAVGPGAGGSGTDTPPGTDGDDAGQSSNASTAAAGAAAPGCDDQTGGTGGLGAPGQGGSGANADEDDSSSGGGGGGGWVGGSGGGAGGCANQDDGAGGGGGAGASYLPTAATLTSLTTADADATPEVVVQALLPQRITFTTTPPNPASINNHYHPHATGGASGNPVVFSADPTSTGCTVSNGVATFTAAGTCVIDADQAGGNGYSAAPTVKQSFKVTKRSQYLGFSQPANEKVGTSEPMHVLASSRLPVVLTDNTKTVCALSGVTVRGLKVGTCSITASQPGNATYAPAAPITRKFQIRPGDRIMPGARPS